MDNDKDGDGKVSKDEAVSWDRPHGTRVEIELEASLAS